MSLMVFLQNFYLILIGKKEDIKNTQVYKRSKLYRHAI